MIEVHDGVPVQSLVSKENYEAKIKSELRQELGVFLRGGIVLDLQKLGNKAGPNLSVIHCLLWVVDGFLKTKDQRAEYTHDLFMPSLARHMATDLFFLFKKGVIRSSDELMLECKREGRRLYFIATEDGQ